jgi:hypothetical protein
VKTFTMVREVDPTGVSGTGVVARGVIFPDGTTVIRWQGQRCSTVVWDTFMDAAAIHGHGGSTKFVFDDCDAGV